MFLLGTWERKCFTRFSWRCNQIMGMKVLWDLWYTCQLYLYSPSHEEIYVQINLTSEPKIWIPSLIAKESLNTIPNLSRIRDFQNVRATRTTRNYLVPHCHCPDEDSEAQREMNLCGALTLMMALEGQRTQEALAPDKDSFHYNRELTSLITQFTKVLQIWIALGLDAGLEGSHESSELGKLWT